METISQTTFFPKGAINNIPAWWLVYRRIYASLGLNELIKGAPESSI